MRRIASASGLLVVAVSFFWMASAAVSDRGYSAVVPLVYADDPPDPNKPKATSSNGTLKNGAATDNDNYQNGLRRSVNLIARKIVAESETLIIDEKVDICVHYTVEGDDDDERFRIGFGVFNLSLQDEQVRVREGDHRECFEVRQPQAGDHLVGAIVDVGNDIAESDEADNRVETLLTWIEPPRPELGVAILVVQARTTSSCDEPVQMATSVSNIGTDSAKRFDVELLIDGEREERERVQDLAPNTMVDVYFDRIKLTPGSHQVAVRADAGNDVDETDEQNNELVSSLVNSCDDIPYEGEDDDDGDDDDDDD
jgi:hypothetical protein